MPLNRLFEQLIVVAHQARQAIGRTSPMATLLVADLERPGPLLQEITRGRNRILEYARYTAIFGELLP